MRLWKKRKMMSSAEPTWVYQFTLPLKWPIHDSASRRIDFFTPKEATLSMKIHFVGVWVVMFSPSMNLKECSEVGSTLVILTTFFSKHSLWILRINSNYVRGKKSHVVLILHHSNNDSLISGSVIYTCTFYFHHRQKHKDFSFHVINPFIKDNDHYHNN